MTQRTASDERVTDLAYARAALSHFTPERPLIVGRNVYDDIIADGGFADMLDRIRLVERLDHHKEEDNA